MLKQRFRAHFGRYSSNLPSSTSQKVITSVTQDNTKSTDLIAQARQVIEKEPLHFSQELGIIGNKGGFDIFREFRAMNKKIDALWEDLRFQQAKLRTQEAKLKTLQVEMNNFQGSLKSTQAKLKSLGATSEILDYPQVKNDLILLITRSGLPDRYITVRRAWIGERGASIRFHRFIINEVAHDEGKMAACAEGFESTYGISPEIYDSHFREAPSSIIEIANLRGDLYYLPDYTRSSHHKAEIRAMRQICDEILSLWVSQNAATVSEGLRAMIAKAGQLHWVWQEEEDNWEPPEEEN